MPTHRSPFAAAQRHAFPHFALKTLSLFLLMAYGPGALAIPTEGQVVSGSATITTPTTQSLVVTQSSQKAVLHWGSFNIGSAETVQFVQPNADAVALNRVIGSDPSSILGRLSANGKVFLVNPNGILFGKGASVNTGSLVASTLDLTDADFQQGQYRFSGNSNAAVNNQGWLQSSLQGYVALLGHTVHNSGSIVAPQGSVALAAGSTVTLNLTGDGLVQARVDQAALNALVENSGLLQAHGGQVQLAAQAQDALLRTVVNHTGIIQANSVARRNGRVLLDGGSSGVVAVNAEVQARGETEGSTGGRIVVTGDKLLLADAARLDASGQAGGGGIYVGGGWQGRDPAIAQANAVYVAAGAQLDASALQKGDGGTVVVWSDIHNLQSSTRVHGTLSARGGVEGGQGGQIETSGHWLSVTGIRADASAPRGPAGVWLLDPEDLIVGGVATDAVVTPGPPTTIFTSGAGTPNVLNTDIEAQLNAGTSVMLQTAPTGGGNGDITIAANIAKTAGTDAMLSFNAIGDINFNAATSITASSGKLHLNFGSGGTIAFAGGNSLATNGGDIGMMAMSVTGLPTLTGSGVEVLNLNIMGPTTIGIGTGAGAMNLPSGFASGFAAVNVLAGLGDITIGGAVSFTDSVMLGTQGNIVIDPASSITTSVVGGSLVLAGTNFLNSAGAAAVTTPGAGARWLVYSTDPATNTFGGLNSGNQAVWGQNPGTLPPFAAPAGNRYVFAAPGAITATTSGTYNKTYGQTANLSGAISYSGAPLNSAGLYGNVYQDLLVTDALATLPTASSAGDLPGASVAGGPYGIAPTGGTANPGYSINLVGGGTVNVLPAPLTISAQNLSQPYSGTGFAGGSLGYSGFVNGETSAVLSGTPVFGGTAQGAVNTGAYTLVPSGLSSSNYTVTYVNGSLTITPATLNITANPATKTYDGLAFGGNAGVSYSGFVNGETPAVLGGSLVYGGSSQGAVNAGLYAIAPSGLSSSNYLVTYNNGQLTVLPAPLVIAANNASKTYDGQAYGGGAGVSYSGLVNGETSAVLSGSLAYGGSSQGALHAGGYAITPGGLSSGNYVIQFNPGTLTVQPKPVTVTGLVASNKDYDGTDSVSIVDWGSVQTGVGAETLVLQTGTANFSDAAIGLNKTVTASGYALANGAQGGLASNYVLSSNAAQTKANIFPSASQDIVQSVQAALPQIATGSQRTQFFFTGALQVDASALGVTINNLLQGKTGAQTDGDNRNDSNSNLTVSNQRIVQLVQTALAASPSAGRGTGASAAAGGTNAGLGSVAAGNAQGGGAGAGTARLASTGFAGGARANAGATGSSPTGAAPASAVKPPSDVFLKGAQRASVIGSTGNGDALVASFSTAGQTTRLQTSVAPGQRFTLKVPADLLGSSGTRGAPAGLVVTTADGTALPAWLQFDRSTMSLTAKDVPANVLPLTVRLVSKSGATVEVELK